MTASPVEVVRSWERAAAALDADAVVALCHEDVAMHTPHRGVLHGHEGIRGFLARQSYGVAAHFLPVRLFNRGDVVVAETRVEYRWVDTDEVGETAERAVAFELRDGRIARIVVHEDLASALAAEGLSEADAV